MTATASSPPTLTASANPSNPTTPAYSDSVEWITAYLVIHMLSDSSRRYTYLLWLAVVLVFLIFAVLHWTGSRGGFIGAYWSKWSLRRRTWRKKHALAVAQRKGIAHFQPTSLPSNAQILSLTVLVLASFALAFVGPDYIAPGIKLWQFYPPSNSGTSDLTTRDASYPTSTFYPFQPQYTISKAWWTSGGRTGLIAFALFPLCVLFALKAPPFALFALPFLIQLYFDKLAWMHRWTGRLIWILSALHVAFWSVQLVKDRRPSTGEIAYQYAWLYTKFIYGWIAFGLLTLLIVLSIAPLRRSHYEVFYFLHVLLVPFTLVMAALHHPPVWWWCWAALALWIGERLYRAIWWLYVNGFVGGVGKYLPGTATYVEGRKTESWELQALDRLKPEPFPLSESQTSETMIPANASFYNISGENSSATLTMGGVKASTISQQQRPMLAGGQTHLLSDSLSPTVYVPPPGYTHAELLSGRTVRLRFITPEFKSWSPGQHFLINIPSIARFTSHPFTVASVCDEQSPSDLGREMVFLVRAKQGWTQDLWDRVVLLTSKGQKYPKAEHPRRGMDLPPKGVLMRMYVDGPFGSAARARWGNHSTVLIVTGGSGASLGLSVLQYICMCMTGRDGQYLGGRPGGWGKKGFRTTRVRFVWLVREFSHLQWCASILRRCMSLVRRPVLQVDIFVTNFKPVSPTRLLRPRNRSYPSKHDLNDADLPRPSPGFVRDSGQYNRPRSDSENSYDGTDDGDSVADEYVDLSYYTGDFEGEPEPEAKDSSAAHRANILELTNFDGDVDTHLPGEEAFSLSVKRTGKLRRAHSRRVASAVFAKQELESRVQSQGETSPHHDHSRHSSQPPASSNPSEPGPSEFGYRHRPQLSITHEEMDLGNPTSPHMTVPDPQWPPISPISDSHKSTLSLGPEDGPSVRPISHNWDARSTATSIRELISQSDGGLADVRLDMDEREMADIDVVSEHARPGKPKIDRILADEVQQSQGSVIVACCGPISLNAMVRKAICAQIDPSRIRRGDARGSIQLVSEEFEY